MSQDRCDKKDCQFWRDTPLGDSHTMCVDCKHSDWRPRSDKDKYTQELTTVQGEENVS